MVGYERNEYPDKCKSIDRCDVCEFRDGKYGFNLLKCKSCGVTVHDVCYLGHPLNDTDGSWECYLCAEVDKNERSLRIKCVLCSVNDGLHAMHPLYDNHGKEGKRIGWVHTICAAFVGTYSITKGTVYACNKDGKYGGEDDDLSDSEEEFDKSTHHYVICNSGGDDLWSKRIMECRKLICNFCGLSDEHVLRIPVQCSAGDRDEIPELKRKYYSSLSRKHSDMISSCSVPMHVGCARWNNKSLYKQVFYFPGADKASDKTCGYQEPKCFVYCNNHAKLIKQSKRKVTTSNPKKCIDLGTTEIPLKLPKKYNEILVKRIERLVKNWAEEESMNSGKEVLYSSIINDKTITALASQVPMSVNELSSLEKNVVKEYGDRLLKNIRAFIEQEKLHDYLKPNETEKQSRSGDCHTDHTHPLVRKTSLDVAPRNKKTKELLIQVRDDVVKKLQNAKPGNEINITNEAKEYWREKSLLSVHDFKELWYDVKKTVRKIMDSKPIMKTQTLQTKKQTLNSPQTQQVDGRNENDNPWKNLWLPHYHHDDYYRLLKSLKLASPSL